MSRMDESAGTGTIDRLNPPRLMRRPADVAPGGGASEREGAMDGGAMDGGAMDGRAWVWFGPVLLALAWPVVHAAVFLVRFGSWPDGGPGASLIFLPMGIVASLVLALLLRAAHQPRQRARILLGDALAAPRDDPPRCWPVGPGDAHRLL
jgi:hypothetical protein